MFRYSQISGADLEIQKHLDSIVSVLKVGKPKSIVLFGAYGKGEGGFVSGNPVNDYDILVVGKKPKEEKYVDVPIKVEIHHVDDTKNTSCTQQWYETKYGSQVLFGEELDLPDWEPYDIPYLDAVNSLDRRVLSMLVGKYEMMKEEPDYYKVMTQVCKMIIALGDAILIKRGQFNPSYRSRLVMLNDDDIRNLYSLAVSHKLFGVPELNPDEVWGLWNQVREYFRQYVITNQIQTNYGEMLINFDERIEADTFKGLLEALGVGSWL